MIFLFFLNNLSRYRYRERKIFHYSCCHWSAAPSRQNLLRAISPRWLEYNMKKLVFLTQWEFSITIDLSSRRWASSRRGIPLKFDLWATKIPMACIAARRFIPAKRTKRARYSPRREMKIYVCQLLCRQSSRLWCRKEFSLLATAAVSGGLLSTNRGHIAACSSALSPTRIRPFRAARGSRTEVSLIACKIRSAEFSSRRYIRHCSQILRISWSRKLRGNDKRLAKNAQLRASATLS